MIIRILRPDEPAFDTVSMHNLVKRNAEDLQRRFPALQECIVKLSPLTPLAVSNGHGNTIGLRHTLNTEETAITITLTCKLSLGKEFLEDSITRELKTILRKYE